MSYSTRIYSDVVEKRESGIPEHEPITKYKCIDFPGVARMRDIHACRGRIGCAPLYKRNISRTGTTNMDDVLSYYSRI